jgi:nucleoside-diphosphate-sugar epimerase
MLTETRGPSSEQELEERLSRPTQGVIDTLTRRSGDIIVLGAGGKMGPTLSMMARRALDAIGRADRVMAVSRFSSTAVVERLESAGVEIVRCDLTSRDAVWSLPDAPNVIFMVGQKFGTADSPSLTWVANTVVPAICAGRYRRSRIVAFSTGNVYPLVSAGGEGATEETPLATVGEYAASCVGRERVLDYYASRNGTPLALVRLNYAIDLRYGVLSDIAQRIWRGEPVDVRMGWVNVIWQGDANARALQCLDHAAVPPFVINVTGRERIAVRALAERLAVLLERPLRLVGEESPDALLSDASRSMRLFGEPAVTLDDMIPWVAAWTRSGGALLGKPTHFETRDGRF